VAVENDFDMAGDLLGWDNGADNRGRARAAAVVRGRAAEEEHRLRMGALLSEESMTWDAVERYSKLV
jgi:hypothetical protein